MRVAAGSSLAGRTVGELALRERTGALLLALRRAAEPRWSRTRSTDTPVAAGAVLIAMGTQAELDALATLATAGKRD